jgi:hypothetical protein
MAILKPGRCYPEEKSVMYRYTQAEWVVLSTTPRRLMWTWMLASEIVEGWCSASRLGRFNHGEGAAVPFWIGGCVAPGAGLNYTYMDSNSDLSVV